MCIYIGYGYMHQANNGERRTNTCDKQRGRNTAQNKACCKSTEGVKGVSMIKIANTTLYIIKTL
mgnify:CR=1 FL=1